MHIYSPYKNGNESHLNSFQIIDKKIIEHEFQNLKHLSNQWVKMRNHKAKLTDSWTSHYTMSQTCTMWLTYRKNVILIVYMLSSVTQSCLTLCNPMDCSMPGLPVHHQLPESTQTHVHWVSDTIQLSNPLSSPALPAFNLFQHQGLFQWVSSLHQHWSIGQ